MTDSKTSLRTLRAFWWENDNLFLEDTDGNQWVLTNAHLKDFRVRDEQPDGSVKVTEYPVSDLPKMIEVEGERVQLGTPEKPSERITAHAADIFEMLDIDRSQQAKETEATKLAILDELDRFDLRVRLIEKQSESSSSYCEMCGGYHSEPLLCQCTNLLHADPRPSEDTKEPPHDEPEREKDRSG